MELDIIKINNLKYLVNDVEVFKNFKGKWVVKGFLTKRQFTDFLNFINEPQ
ncbi:MAG: hypothetical protein KGV59_01560 [Tenacibaculum sp.]|nr:hypothetical protein [Tenacibaculum sp.]